MASSRFKMFLALACLAWLPHARAEAPPRNTRHKVEFRRAEREPAEGLTAAAVLMPPRRVYLHEAADATDEDIAEARAVLDRRSHPAVLIRFTEDGAKKMTQLSKHHKDRPLAIIVDGRVIVAPELRTTLSDQAMITGNFTQSEIDAMVAFINADRSGEHAQPAPDQGQEKAERDVGADSR